LERRLESVPTAAQFQAMLTQALAASKKEDMADMNARIIATVDSHLASSLAPRIEGIMAPKIGDIDESLSKVTSMHGEVLKYSKVAKTHAARNAKESADIVLLAEKERQSITNATQASLLSLEKESTKLKELRRDVDAAESHPSPSACVEVPKTESDSADGDDLSSTEASFRKAWADKVTQGAPPPPHGPMIINGERAPSRQMDPRFATNLSPDPITHLFNTYPAAVKVHHASPLKCAKPESLVVLSCMCTLFSKGYGAKQIELEKTWTLGHREKGRLDVLIRGPGGNAYALIECKTWGAEYTKARNKLLEDGGQLFSYYVQERDAQTLYLYAASLDSPTTPKAELIRTCLLYTSPSPRDVEESRMPSSA